MQELPAVTERESHGEAAWFIADQKNFAAMRDQHHDERVAVVLAAPQGVQGALVSDDPLTYFVPPYVGSRGWLGIYLDDRDAPAPPAALLREYLRDAWRLVAPAKLHGSLVDE